MRAANLDLHHFGQRDKAPKVLDWVIFIDFRENAVAFVIELEKSRKMTVQEIYLSLEQARHIGELRP